MSFNAMIFEEFLKSVMMKNRRYEIAKQYELRRTLKADLYFGGWSDEELFEIADCIIALLKQGLPATSGLLAKYSIWLNEVKDESTSEDKRNTVGQSQMFDT